VAWTEITALESGYFAVGDPYAQPAYRREGSTLKLRGAVEQDSDSPEVIFDGPVFTLPEADRPSETQVVSISRREPAGDILAASIVVAADGTVSPASTEWPDQALFLDGVEIDLPITVAPDAADWAPSVEDVANQLRARTKGGVSEMDEVGTFDATTRPTGDEVEALIAGAVEDVRGVFTAADVPEACQALAQAGCHAEDGAVHRALLLSRAGVRQLPVPATAGALRQRDGHSGRQGDHARRLRRGP
jgi:hypothetical protein